MREPGDQLARQTYDESLGALMQERYVSFMLNATTVARLVVSDTLTCAVLPLILPGILLFSAFAWCAEKIAGSDENGRCRCLMCQPGFKLCRISREAKPGAANGRDSQTPSDPVTPEPREPGEEREALIEVIAASKFDPESMEIWEATLADGILAAGFRRSPASIGDEAESEGAKLIAAERARQVAVEGWTAEHDDEHADDKSLARAALSYVYETVYPAHDTRSRAVGWGWPWDPQFWKPTSPIRMLVKAGALIAAEIDRRNRAALTAVPAKDREDEA